MPAPSVPVSPVRIAVIQFDPQVGLDQCDNNLCKGLQLAEEAVHDGANLIVLPELANTGYTFETRAEAYAHAETLDEGPSIKTWRAFAREHQVYLVAGFAERDGLKLYDSAVLFGPDGLLVQEWRGLKVPGHVDEVLKAVKGLKAAIKKAA